MPEVEILQIPGNFNFIDMDKQHIQKKKSYWIPVFTQLPDHDAIISRLK